MENQLISRHESDDNSDLKKSSQDVADLIYRLLERESFGVLCTQAEEKPYGSIVAFTFEKDMKAFVFGTPRETQKYRYLTQCDRVALLVDSRDQFPDDFKRVEAVTITGRAREVGSGLAFDTLAQLYILRHPELKSFIDASSTALFSIKAENFTYVTEFQKVYHWSPLVGG